MDYQTEVLRLLTSIDASLKKLTQSQQGADVAPDRDLDGKWGNPLVRFIPRDWTGDDFRHRQFSECDPRFLDLMAESLEYFAMKAEEKDERTDRGKPVAPLKRQDAARARGWAKRIREGKHTPRELAPVGESSADGWTSEEGPTW